MDFVGILQDYGFPMLAAVAMAYFIYFIYTFITTEIKVKFCLLYTSDAADEP